MLRIIVSLGIVLLFAFAENCDFTNEAQSECEIDIKNPPLMLHKFDKADGSEYAEYRACINGGDIEIDNARYEVLDCSMVESKSGNLTEGISITNNKNLLKNKIITLKQDNVLMRVAGDLIIDSGVRFNIKNPKNFVVEIIEGTNTKSNLVLERGALLKISSLIMPEGRNSSVWLNTFYGGIYEREFIDTINQKNPKLRGEMETLLNVDDMLALSRDGESVLGFNGNIFCGPKVNPLDLSNKDYTLKRLFRTKNNSATSPNKSNAICDVKEGGCFDNILNFSNQKIDAKNYKIATARANIIPTYEIFIESGKIISSDNRNIASIAPNANLNEQNYGKCETPTKVAFEKAIIDEYLLAMGGGKKAKDSSEVGTDSTKAVADSSESLKSKGDEVAQNSTDKDAHSPINAEMQAELDENIQDLLKTFGIKKEPKANLTQKTQDSNKDLPKETKDSNTDLAKETADSKQKIIEVAQDSKQDSSPKSAESAKETAESTKPTEIAKTAEKPAQSKPKSKQPTESKQLTKMAKKDETKSDKSTQITQDSAKDSSQDSAKIAVDSTQKADSAPKAETKTESKPTQIAEAPKSTDFKAKSKPESKAKSATKQAIDSTPKTQEKATTETKTANIDDENLKTALLEPEKKLDKQPDRKPKPAGKDEFLIVEKDAYEKLNRDCYGDLKCLYNTLQPYDGVVWSKKSSKDKQNTLYFVNLSDDNLKLECEVRNYYGKNLKKSYALSHTNKIAALDMKFESSYDRTQVICKTPKTTKATNKIIVTPASFDLKYHFANEGTSAIPTLKAGIIKIAFDESRALTMEGDVDNGFGGNLAVQNLTFTQKNKCDGSVNANVSVPEGLNLRFKKGYLQNAYADISANTIAFGHLNIDFKIANDDNSCVNGISSGLEPQCTSANIAKDISIIPANFRVKTDILADNGSNQIAYYGQIDDKHTFRYNPLLSVDIEALDSDNKPIDVNKSCNYGSIELSLKNDKLIEFKRSSSDRLNSRIVAYLRDFEKPAGTNLKAYFGISKIVDKYKNSRTIAQSDAIEPNEVTLTDFRFNIRFKNGKSQFDYDNVDVYDRLDEHSNPLGILFVRGKLQTNDIKGDTESSPSLIAKYAIYCKSCDKKILAKYLQSEPEIESQYWYINNKHPSGLYLSNSFIKVAQNSKNRIEIQNSNRALEGRQQIVFKGKKSGIYPIAIAQRSTEFAPYLNYNDKYKNTYLSNSFNVMISEPERKDILLDIETIKKEDSTPKSNVAPKPASKHATKTTAPKAQNKDDIWLDIEE